MNKDLDYVSQLASGRVLWNEHSQDSGMWTDLQSLVPFSIPMKVDLTPWLDWIKAHDVLFTSSWVTANKPIGDILALSMSTWMNDWRQKMGYSAQQADIFMDEWKYVLAAPCLAEYRQSSTGMEQLNKIAGHVYTSNDKHVEAIRDQWAYDTLRLLPDIAVCQVAFTVWAEATPEVRQGLNPTWAQWYDLFGDSPSFLACVRQEAMLCEETLPLPDALQSESLGAP